MTDFGIRCRRCGDPFEMRTAKDRHCARCVREVDLILARPQPAWTPRWLERLTARDETKRAA